MTENPRETATQAALHRLIWPKRLTLAGLWAERVARAFWPLWTLLIATLAVLSFGAQDTLPLEAVWVGAVVVVLGTIAALVYAYRTFRRPTEIEALARLDASLPGRPISALTDTQAIGATDPASMAVWQAHLRRMAARASSARAVAPDLKLAKRDPFALRYLALTAFVIALMFGSIWRVASVTGMGPGGADAMAMGPTWEGWAQPPVHTGKPSLYLNDIEEGALSLPTGSRIQVRLYGEVGDLTVAETVSGVSQPEPAAEPAQEFTVTRSGMDFKLVCRTCGREIMIPRAKAERHIKKITHPEEQ